MAQLFARNQPSRRMPAAPQQTPCYMVYVLRGQNGGYYIGCTRNLPQRLAAHRAGEVRGSAKLGDPGKLDYVHAWHVPDEFSGDLLETFAWRFHRYFGVRQLIASNPHWSSELRAAASEITPNEYEQRHKYTARPTARTAAC